MPANSVADVEGTIQLGMLMFIVSNIVGSSIQITTLPLPVLSTLQAVEVTCQSAISKRTDLT